MSKLDLTNLLIKAGITNYTYKVNIFESELKRRYPVTRGSIEKTQV